MADEETTERGPTRRVVLRRERVIVLPESVDVGAIDAKALAEALGMKSGKVPTALVGLEVWAEVRTVEAASKSKAIEAVAGKPGTPDATPGAYRAPSERAWKGGAVYERPPEPIVQRTLLD